MEKIAYECYNRFNVALRSKQGLGGVMVRVLASNLCGHRFESRAGRFMLESW